MPAAARMPQEDQDPVVLDLLRLAAEVILAPPAPSPARPLQPVRHLGGRPGRRPQPARPLSAPRSEDLRRAGRPRRPARHCRPGRRPQRSRRNPRHDRPGRVAACDTRASGSEQSAQQYEAGGSWQALGPRVRRDDRLDAQCAPSGELAVLVVFTFGRTACWAAPAGTRQSGCSPTPGSMRSLSRPKTGQGTDWLTGVRGGAVQPCGRRLRKTGRTPRKGGFRGAEPRSADVS